MKNRLFIPVLILLAMIFIFSSCEGEEQHTHTEEIIPAVAPTCTDTGLTEGKKCSVCQEILVSQKTIAATDVHKFENSYTCTMCKKEFYKESVGLEFTLSDDGTFYIVSGVGTCSDTNIVIPYTYNNLPVTVITSAFLNCSNLTSIVIPNSVTTIGRGAFFNCSNLTSIVIPDSVTWIGKSAFDGCSSLTSIVIPDSVTEIGSGAFKGCSSLTSIVIPDSVTEIGISNTFKDCTSLASVTIGNNVTFIGERTFSNCTSLESVTIPSSVTKIEYMAFVGCTSLESIYIPNSVTEIGNGAFLLCDSLTIYCEATEKPSSWSSSWNRSYPVVWGHAHAYENGSCVCGKTQN